jgi:hypothetical protein
MTLFMKLLLMLVLIFAVLLPMMIKGPNGQPIMALEDWLPDSYTLLANLPLSLTEVVQLGSDEPASRTATQADAIKLSANSGQIYKWQDQQGRWHFSSEKPVLDVNAQLEQLPELENVMEAPVNEGDNSSSLSLPGFLVGQ